MGTNSATFTPGIADVGKFLRVTISYTDGNGTPESVSSPVTANITVKLVAPVITGPTPVTPYQRPTITRTSVSEADRYQIRIKNQSTNVNPFLQVTRTSTAFYPASDLGIGRYNLWIRSGSPDGQFSDYTPQYDFRIVTKATFYAVARYQTNATPTIAWKPLTGATKYDLWINNLSTGQLQVVRDAGLTATSWTSPTALPMGDYRAWVRGLDASGHASISRSSAVADWMLASGFVPEPTADALDVIMADFTDRDFTQQ